MARGDCETEYGLALGGGDIIRAIEFRGGLQSNVVVVVVLYIVFHFVKPRNQL